MDFNDSQRRALLEIADRMGLISSMTQEEQAYLKENREDFLVNEAWARYITDTVLWDINPELEVHQHPHFDTFDVDFYSGRTVQLETKCRNFVAGKYKTSKISYRKGDAIDQAKGFLLIFYNDDGHYRIFDLENYKPRTGTWNKKHYTAGSKDLQNYEEEERCWIFDNDAAIIEGNLKRRNGTGKGSNRK